MNTLPFAPSVLGTFWSDIMQFPFVVISLVLFAVALHRGANKLQCYGLARNLLFGAATGALAFVSVQLYALGRQHGLHLSSRSGLQSPHLSLTETRTLHNDSSE